MPSSRFWSGLKHAPFVQIETGFSCEIGCGGGAPVICLFARVIQQLGSWTQKIQANVDYCCLAPRRVHFARPWTQASKPALTDSGREETCRGVSRGIFFNQASEPRSMTYCCCCCCCCVHSRMIHSHERRVLGALPFLVSRSEPASTDS